MARNASRDLGPSSPPNLISSSRGAARNRGVVVGEVGLRYGRGETGVVGAEEEGEVMLVEAAEGRE